MEATSVKVRANVSSAKVGLTCHQWSRRPEVPGRLLAADSMPEWASTFDPIHRRRARRGRYTKESKPGVVRLSGLRHSLPSESGLGGQLLARTERQLPTHCGLFGTLESAAFCAYGVTFFGSNGAATTWEPAAVFPRTGIPFLESACLVISAIPAATLGYANTSRAAAWPRI